MPVINNVDYGALARSRYTSQFADDPVFDALVQTLVEYKMTFQKECINIADTILDIDKAVGKNLDLIGSIVGQPRVLVEYFSKPFFGFYGNPLALPYDKGTWYSMSGGSGGESRILEDDEYRKAIKARIIRNYTNCSRKDFIAILYALTGEYDFTIETPSHGHIVVKLPSKRIGDMVSYFLSRTEENDSLIPRPLGYRLSVTFGD